MKARVVRKKVRKNRFFAIKVDQNSVNAIFDPGWDGVNAECPILGTGCAAANSRRPILQQRVSKVK